MRKTFDFGNFFTILAQILDRRGPKCPIFEICWKNQNITFLQSLRLAFMQKIREIQYAVFEKCGKPSILGIFDHFGSKWPILDRRGPKWPIFEFSWKNQKIRKIEKIVVNFLKILNFLLHEISADKQPNFTFKFKVFKVIFSIFPHIQGFQGYFFHFDQIQGFSRFSRLSGHPVYDLLSNINISITSVRC